MNCEASKFCKQPAELHMSWLVHTRGLDEPAERMGGNYCGGCSAAIWDKVSAVPFCASSVIIQPPMNVSEPFSHEPWKGDTHMATEQKDLVLIADKNKPGPSSELLQRLEKTYPTYGAASWTEDGTVQHVGNNGEWPDFTAMRNEFPDIIIVLFASKAEKPFADEDQQPFSCIENDEGHSLLALYVEGEFPTIDVTDEKHSKEWHVFQEIRDMIGKHLENVENLDQLREILIGPAFHKEVKKLMTRGTIALHFSTGDVELYVKNPDDRAKEFKQEGFWLSDTRYLKDEEEKPAEVKKEEPPKRRSFMKVTGSEKEDRETDEKAVAIATSTSVPTTSPAKEAMQQVQSNLNAKEEMISPPDEIKTKHDLSNWYKKHREGGTPKDFEKRPPIPFSELRQGSHHRIKKGFVSLQQHPVAADEMKKAVVTETVILIPPKQKEELQQKFLPAVKKVTPDVLKTYQENDELRSKEMFHSQMSYALDDALLWDKDTIVALCSMSTYKAQAAMILELRTLLFEHAPHLFAKKVEETKTTPAAASTEKKKGFKMSA